MADLSKISTEELMRLRGAPSFDLSKLSTEELMRLRPRVSQPDAIELSAMAALKPTRLERLGRGVADVTQGITQLFKTGDDAKAYSAEKTDELNLYEKGRGPDAGIDWMRLGGNVAATAPVALIPGLSAPTLLPRVVSGATQGAVSSGSMFTPEGESKLQQTLIGAGFGGAVPAVISSVRNTLTNLAGKFNPDRGIDTAQLSGELKFQLEKNGINWNKLTKNVQESLLSDAKKTLDTGGALDAVQLARKADIESVGAKGTKAAISRDPKDWRTMQNLRPIDNAGEGIAARQSDDARAMTDYLQQLRNKTGGTASTPLEAGESTIAALKAKDESMKAGVNAAYGSARDNLGRASPMDSNAFSRQANLALDENMLGNHLPSEVRGILNDVTAGKIPFNVNTAVQIDSVLSAAQRSAGNGTPQSLAIGKVRDALNAAPIESSVGEDAKRAFDSARGMARNRFAVHEQTPAIGAAVDGVSPDKFVKQFIFNADANTLKGTINQLKTAPGGAQAVSDIKGHLFDNLLMKATGQKSIDDIAFASAQPSGLTFSGKAFSNALNEIPAEKLHILFNPSELQSLRTLQRASRYLTEDVPLSDVNYSRTAAAMTNILQKIGNTPMLSKILSPITGAAAFMKGGIDLANNAAQRAEVAKMLLSSAGITNKGAKLLPPPGDFAQFAPAIGAGVGQRLNDE